VDFVTLDANGDVPELESPAVLLARKEKLLLLVIDIDAVDLIRLDLGKTGQNKTRIGARLVDRQHPEEDKESTQQEAEQESSETETHMSPNSLRDVLRT